MVKKQHDLDQYLDLFLIDTQKFVLVYKGLGKMVQQFWTLVHSLNCHCKGQIYIAKQFGFIFFYL